MTWLIFILMTAPSPAEIELLHELSRGAPPAAPNIELPADLKIAAELPVELSPRVHSWIAYWAGRGRAGFEGWLARLDRERGPIEDELVRAGLPRGLIYVAVIESGLLPEATSTAGAAGIWQFMPETARALGLEVSTTRDERRDNARATAAAVTLLRQLHDRFDTWPLALTAYNAGPTALARAIERGRSRELGELDAYLTPEARNFVPKICAALILGENREAFGLRGEP